MISISMLKNSARVPNALKTSKTNFWLNIVNSNKVEYTKKEVKFFTSEMCNACKEKLNLNSDKFVKRK